MNRPGVTIGNINIDINIVKVLKTFSKIVYSLVSSTTFRGLSIGQVVSSTGPLGD